MTDNSWENCKKKKKQGVWKQKRMRKKRKTESRERWKDKMDWYVEEVRVFLFPAAEIACSALSGASERTAHKKQPRTRKSSKATLPTSQHLHTQSAEYTIKKGSAFLPCYLLIQACIFRVILSSVMCCWIVLLRVALIAVFLSFLLLIALSLIFFFSLGGSNPGFWCAFTRTNKKRGGNSNVCVCLWIVLAVYTKEKNFSF